MIVIIVIIIKTDERRRERVKGQSRSPSTTTECVPNEAAKWLGACHSKGTFSVSSASSTVQEKKITHRRGHKAKLA